MQKIVCPISSFLIFSIFLSFIIALYNLVPLTPSAIKHGIAIKFCKSILLIAKMLPLFTPKIEIKADIVYPKQNPLKHIIMYTVELRIQIRTPIERLLINEFLSTDISEMLLFSCKDSTKLLM